jgi:hypothetical protein
MTVSSCFAFTTFVLCAACQCVLGANAVFSKDGQHIYVAVWEYEATGGTAQLRHIALSKATIKSIPFKESSGSFTVSRSENEDILCASETALWRYHPADGTFTKVCDAPKDFKFEDVAYNPKTHAILLPARETLEASERDNPCRLFLLKDLASTPETVSVWRLDPYDGVQGPVFDANGELFFSNHGDLWHGNVMLDAVPGLRAYRYAPLATLETDLGASPAQKGVLTTALARNFIYVFITRMWGSGYWWLARLPRLPRATTKRLTEQSIRELPFAFGTHLELPDRWGIYRQVFDSVKILTEETSDRLCYLCASADESRVYYTINGKHWLIINGKLQELHLDPKSG